MGDVPAVLDRPLPLRAKRARPQQRARADRPAPVAALTAELVDGHRGQRVLVHVQANNDHDARLLPLGATGERTDLNRGKLPSSYQVTLDGLGKATATQHWQVGESRHSGIESAAAFPSLSPASDDTPRR
jgi:hypothetical protein